MTAFFVSADILLVLLLFAPLVFFLLFGWPTRKRDIFALLSEEAVALYYAAFFPTEVADSRKEMARFEEEFYHRYGRRFYVLPCLVLLVVSGFLSYLCMDAVSGLLGFESRTGLGKYPVALAGIAGAYMWVLTDFI